MIPLIPSEDKSKSLSHYVPFPIYRTLDMTQDPTGAKMKSASVARRYYTL